MANTIKHKRSSTASATPVTTDLALGEIAINTYDGKLFIKKDDGTESIVEIGAGGGASALGDLSDVTITSPSSSVVGDFLKYTGSSWENVDLPSANGSTPGIVSASDQIFNGRKKLWGGGEVKAPWTNQVALFLTPYNASQSADLLQVWDSTNTATLTINDSGNLNANQISATNYLVTSANAFSTTLSPSSGALTVDASNGNVVLGALSASVSEWAFTNVSTSNSRVTTISVFIDGNTSYTYGSTCSVNGTAVSGGVVWLEGSAPISTNDTDVITFILIKDSAGTVKVFGSGNGSPTYDAIVANTIHAKTYTETISNAFSTSLTPSAGVITVDASLGSAVLGALSASVTEWAFTNVSTDNSKGSTVTVILDGNSSYTYGSDCSVNGTSVTGGVVWLEGSAPTATNNTDVLTFILIKDSAGTIKVLGSGSGSSSASSSSSSSPTGSVIAFAGSTAPTGWLICDGTAVSRTTYADLFTIIGTSYGSGDGSTTFNVPDLIRRAPLGKGSSDSLGDSDGVAAASRTLSHTHSVPAHYHGTGTLAVASSGTLTTSSDSHNHTFSGTTGANSTNQFPGKANSSAGNASSAMRANSSGTANNTFDTYFNHTHTFSGTTTTDTHNHTISGHTHTLSGSVGATGGVDGDSAMTSGSYTPPHLIMNYIIKS